MTIQTFNPVQGVASAQGIDVSNFQGNYNWPGVKKDVPNLAFGIFRLTEGLPASHDNSPDPFAAHNRASIHDAGLVQGAYHFLHPSLSGKAQAQYFVDEYGKLGLFDADMLWLDNESTDGLGPAAVAACAQDFMAELKVLRPHNPQGVYSNLNFAFTGYDAGLGKYPWWAAHPGSAPVPPPEWSKWTFWQWGTRSGADADAFNGTVSDFQKWCASFAAPTGPVKHATDGKTTITGYAAQHSMNAGGWLYEQQQLLGTAAANNLGEAVPSAGLTYVSKH